MKHRISRERMFMEMTHIVARRSTCNRARVGAALVQDNKVISIGYNGSPSGEPHCDDVGHLMFKGHCIRTVHAEMNCLDSAYPRLESPMTLYVSHYPCASCIEMIMEYNISHPLHPIDVIIYDYDYRNDIPGQDYDPEEEIPIFKGGGVSVRQLQEM